MSTIVKFISTKYIKENTLIEFNVDDNKLSSLILKIQKVYLEQSLGSSFYNHLSQAVANNTVTAHEDKLIREYVQPMIAEYTVYEALPHMHFKLTDKGVVNQNSEWSTSSDLDDIKYMRSNIRDVAEIYQHRLVKYIYDNQQFFPEWTNRDLPENQERNTKSFFNGIYIPNKGGCNGC